MKAEIEITGENWSEVKAAAFDFQMTMEGQGWRFCGVRSSPKNNRAVVVLRKDAP